MSLFGNIVSFAGEVADQTKNIASETVTAIGDFPNTVKNLPDTFNNAANGMANTAQQLAGRGQVSADLGVATLDTAAWMKNLEGKRLHDPSGKIWLVLDAKKRHIQNPSIYNGMFGGNFEMGEFAQEVIDHMPEGAAIVADPPLVSPSSGGVFLIDEGKKRHIANPDTMSFYKFDWARIVNNHNNSYPDGEHIMI